MHHFPQQIGVSSHFCGHFCVPTPTPQMIFFTRELVELQVFTFYFVVVVVVVLVLVRIELSQIKAF
jgi:hypothetical protein